MTGLGTRFKKQIASLILLPSIFFLAHPCMAESTSTSEWDISADKITRIEDPAAIIAEGNIVLTKKIKTISQQKKRRPKKTAWSELLEEKIIIPPATQEEAPIKPKITKRTDFVIKADWISYDIDSQSIKARGNIVVIRGDDQIYAEKAQFDLQSETGSFNDAKVIRKDHDLHLEGETIEKTGLKTFRIEDGWVITCKVNEGEVPPWSLHAKETNVEHDGYAVLKHAKFKIKDVPVFYSPWMFIPVKETRQTGFLFPELTTSSRDGFGFNLPFFINISDSSDMTLFPEYYSERGVMPGLEFRYVLSEKNKGFLMGSYLKDDLSDPSETEYYDDTGFTHTNDERYWLRGKFDHNFESKWVLRADIDVVSDEDFLEEFSSGVTGFNDSNERAKDIFGRGFQDKDEEERDNTLRLLRAWEGSSLNIKFLAVNDSRTEDVTPTELWEMPRVDYKGVLPIGSSPVNFEWDTDYIYYWREEGVGGHRFDIWPRLSTPINLGPYLESRAELGARETIYNVETRGDDVEWEYDDNQDRFLWNFETEVATTLVRDYQTDKEGYSYLRHNIRPFLMYDYRPDEDQSEMPDFDEDVDQLEARDHITFGFQTFLDYWKEDKKGAEATDFNLGFLRISQSYDMTDEGDEDPWTPLLVKLGWKPMDKMIISYRAEIPFRDKEEDEEKHSFEFNYSNSRGDKFILEYYRDDEDDDDNEQFNGHIKSKIFPQILAELKWEYSLQESELNEGIAGITYLQPCWSVQLKGKVTPTDERVTLLFRLANIGDALGIGL